ncbi:MAG: hypothetical protein WD607_08425 [Candidatus Paceibacterota bacterium]
MRDFQQLYDEVLRELPFSIVGHINLEEKLYEFYDKLSYSNFIRYNQNFTFLFSAVLELDTEQDDFLLEWHVKSYKKFYFKSYKKVAKRAVLSVYFWILKKLNSGRSPLKPSLIFSQLFGDDLDFKISLYDEEIPFLDYDQKERLFEIKLPYKIFEEKIRKSSFHNRINLIKNFDSENEIVDNPDGFDRYFELKSEDTQQQYDFLDSFYKELFDINQTKKVRKYLEENLQYFDFIFNKFESEKKEKELYVNFTKCCIALSFLCFHFDSSMEYMMSVAKVNWERDKKRNLGGLIIGYKSDYTLKSDERMLLNMISDRLTSVVAGNHMIKEHIKKNKPLYAKHLQMHRKQAYSDILEACGKDMHNGDTLDTTQIEKFQQIVKKYEDHVYLFYKIKDQVITAKNCYKYEYITLSNRKALIQATNNDNSIYNYLSPYNPEMVNSISLDIKCNIKLIEEVFNEITTPSINKNLEIIENTNDEGYQLEINFARRTRFDIENFYSTFKEKKDGGLTGIFMQNYLLIMAHGNMQLYEGENKIFDFFENLNLDQKTDTIIVEKPKEINNYSSTNGLLEEEIYNYKFIIEIN